MFHPHETHETLEILRTVQYIIDMGFGIEVAAFTLPTLSSTIGCLLIF
jgi:hypothetical protein